MAFTICLFGVVLLTLASWYFWVTANSDGPKWRRGATVYGLIVGSAAVLLLVAFLVCPPLHASTMSSESGVSLVLGWARVGFLLALLGLLVSAFGLGKARVFLMLAMGLILIFWFKSLMLV